MEMRCLRTFVEAVEMDEETIGQTRILQLAVVFGAKT